MKALIAPKWQGLLYCAGVTLCVAGVLLYVAYGYRSAPSGRPRDHVEPAKTMELSRRAFLRQELERLARLSAAPIDPQANPLAAPLSKESANRDSRSTQAVADSQAPHTATLTVTATQPGSGYAVVDGRVVRRGDRLSDGSVVMSIGPATVVLWTEGSANRVLHIENRFAEQPNAN